MNSDSVLHEKRNGVAWIRFNRPHSRNAMTWEMYDALERLCQEIEHDDDVHCVVLGGCGGQAFVAGTDISQFVDFSEPEDGIRYERRIDRVVSKLETLNKPTIAMIEGFCVGGGAALALTCDFRYCTPSLKFGVPIANTLGNCLSITNVSRLIDMIGIARTKEALMMAKLFNADEARHVGLVNDVFPAETIGDDVASIAAEFSKRAPLTLKASKALIGRVQEQRRAARDASDDWIVKCYTSQDFNAAVNRFVNKKPFEWTGR